MANIAKFLINALIVCSALFAVNFACAEASPVHLQKITVDDFVYEATLSNATSSLRQVALPLSIYENIARKDHGDLRVFNSDNQIVPHQFIRVNTVDTQQQHDLKFYPFSKEQAANPNNVRVVISQTMGKQHLEINQQLNGSKTTNFPKVQNEYQYIILNEVEGSKDKRALCKIKLDWVQTKPNMILPLRLESSDDLQKWYNLSRTLNVSKLDFSGSQIVNKEVKFPCTTQQYLRLTWLKPEQRNHLNKVYGIYAQQGKQTIETAVLSKPHYDANGHLLFENGLNIALSSMAFVSLQDNLLIKGRLFSRNNESDSWRFRQNILQYRLSIADAKLNSKPFSLPQNSDRYWRLELVNEGQLSANQLPEIQGRWQQEKLVYLAQGKGPFKLAYGNPIVKPANNTGLSQLIQSVNDSGTAFEQVEVSNPHKARELAKIEKEIPWEKIGLWALLLIGTAVLGYMALSLYRQMGENKE